MKCFLKGRIWKRIVNFTVTLLVVVLTIAAGGMSLKAESAGRNASAVTIEDQAPALASVSAKAAEQSDMSQQESEITKIEEEATPLVVKESHCLIHWLILAIVIIYEIWFAVRFFVKSREINKRTDRIEKNLRKLDL